MHFETLASILALVLNSALLSSFIIPQVQKLKEIKDKLFDFKLTYVPSSGVVSSDRIELKDKRKSETSELQSILDTYRLRSEELASTVNKFYLSILVGMISTGIAVIWPTTDQIVVPSHAIAQLVILWWAVKTYAADPDRISSLGYLVRECDVNPHLLVSATDLNISLTYQDETGRQTQDSPLTVNLSMDLRLREFRFFYSITGKEDRVYYVSCGPISARTKLWRHLLHPAFGMPEYNRIEVGKIRFNRIDNPNELRTWALVFMPFYPQEKNRPLYASTNLNHLILQPGTFLSSGVSLGPIDTDMHYEGITYVGQDTIIRNLQFHDDTADATINKVVKKFVRPLLKARGICQFEDITGRLLDS